MLTCTAVIFLLNGLAVWAFLPPAHKTPASALPLAFTNNVKPTPYAFGVAERLKRASMLAILPVEMLDLDRIGSLNKKLVGWPFTATFSQDQLIGLVDNSPFCVVAEHLTANNFCIFVDPAKEAENYEGICSWVRQIKDNRPVEGEPKAAQHNNEILLCKKGHLIKINA